MEITMAAFDRWRRINMVTSKSADSYILQFLVRVSQASQNYRRAKHDNYKDNNNNS